MSCCNLVARAGRGLADRDLITGTRGPSAVKTKAGGKQGTGFAASRPSAPRLWLTGLDGSNSVKGATHQVLLGGWNAGSEFLPQASNS